MSFPSSSVTGIDISQEAVGHASENYVRENLLYKAQDIHLFLDKLSSIDAYLLVNSIFLLPQPEQILKKIHDKISTGGKLGVIIPNIESENFRNFQQLEPELNCLLLDRGQAQTFFENAGFKTEAVKGLSFIHLYGNRTLEKLGKLRGLYTYAADRVNHLIGKKPSYWGFILSRQ